MRNMLSRKISFLIFDYKGFGDSDGYTMIDSTYDDAEVCYNYMVTELGIKKSNIVPMSESIGTYPAVRLAQDKGLKKVIILCGINSISLCEP